MHSSFKFNKKNLNFYISYNFLKTKDDFITVCKYINFNNLNKKKGFIGVSVVVGWSLPLQKHKKQLKKHEK